ncbi:MAG: alpha/beta hydrolase [Actinomycetota bacterium]|nr:alpha/beta hydrolase [Actinomycetota bacterium]
MHTGNVSANGVRFAYVESGPHDGALALCLHGFPDSARTWRYLLDDLASAGFRAVAPFMRGYAPTDVPSDGNVHAGALVADANSLHEALGGRENAVIIGHDWGALAAYGAAAHSPQRWRRAVALAVPPLVHLMQGFVAYEQIHASWYMFFFRHPLAEAVVQNDDLAFIDRLWAAWSPGYDGTADAEAAKEALRDPAHLSCALGYYRALLDPSHHSERFATEQAAVMSVPAAPTLYLHGSDDRCILPQTARGAERFLPAGSSMSTVDGAGHFLHLERPGDVNSRIVDFLSAP